MRRHGLHARNRAVLTAGRGAARHGRFPAWIAALALVCASATALAAPASFADDDETTIPSLASTASAAATAQSTSDEAAAGDAPSPEVTPTGTEEAPEPDASIGQEGAGLTDPAAQATNGAKAAPQATASGWNPHGYTLPTPTNVSPSTYYQVADVDNQTATQLYKAELVGGEYKQVKIGSATQGFKYNGITIDPNTNALWGWVTSGTGKDFNNNPIKQGDFLYIDRENGRLYDWGVPTEMGNANATGFNLGAAGNGTLYFSNSGTTSRENQTQYSRFRLWKVNLSRGTASSLALSRYIVMPSDFTFVQNHLWGRADGNGGLVRIDPSTGRINQFGLPDNMPNGTDEKYISGTNQGGAFTFGNGNIGIVMNDGQTIQLSIGNAGNSLRVVARYKSAAGIGTDGAAAISSAVDLGITKVADKTSVEAGGKVT